MNRKGQQQQQWVGNREEGREGKRGERGYGGGLDHRTRGEQNMLNKLKKAHRRAGPPKDPRARVRKVRLAFLRNISTNVNNDAPSIPFVLACRPGTFVCSSTQARHAGSPCLVFFQVASSSSSSSGSIFSSVSIFFSIPAQMV